MNQNQKCGILPNLPLRKLFSFFLFFPSFFLFSIQSSSAQYQNTQRAVSKTVYSTIRGFYESLPVDYASNPTKKYPLLIFLHGVGELGNGTTELPLVLKNAIPKMLNKGTFPASFTVGGEKFSFIVISPQFTQSAGQPDAIEAMIDYCIQHYRVDASRIYLTGLSLGGKRTWDFPASARARADKLAAIVPVCSGATGSTSDIANVTGASVPMWFLNNSDDPYISATKALQLVNTINLTSISPKAKITIHQASGHDAWTKSYDPNFRVNQMNVYEWMLSYKRGASSQPAPSAPESTVLAANAGSNQVITLPTNSVTVDGSTGSTYPTGSTFLWVKKDGPAGGTISSPNSLKTTITGLNSAGDYQFALRITDKNGKISSSSMHVIVNAAPASTTTLKSSAGGNQTITLPTNSVTVDGGESTYPTGSTFLWVKKDGPVGGTISSPNSLKTTISGLNTAGDYQFTLRITDKNGNLSSSSMHVIVNAAPASTSGTLKSSAGTNRIITLPKNSIMVDGSESSYPTGSTFLWVKKDGPAGGTISNPNSLQTIIGDLNTPGDYQFALRITDRNGNLSSSSMHVIVNPDPASILKSSAGPNRVITLPKNSIIVDGSESTYPIGSTFLWVKKDGPAGGTISSPKSLQTTIGELNTPGDYQFALRITDKNGNLSSSSMHVIVNPDPASVLKSNAGADRVITLPKNSIIVDGSESTYPTGSTFLWVKKDGPAGGTISNPNSLQTTIGELNTPGDYQFALRITDKNGNLSSSSMHVIVKSAVSARTATNLDVNVAQDQSSQLVGAGISSASTALEVKINPNPVQSDMTVQVSGRATGKTNVIVYSLTGQVLLQQEFVKNTSGLLSKTFNVSKLAAGTYIAQIIVDNKYKKAVKILKQ